MDKLVIEFKKILKEGNRKEVLDYIIHKIDNKEIDVIDLYCKVIMPLLNNMECDLEDKNICKWKEQVKGSIIRTVIECLYPYVIMKKEESNYSKKGVAVVMCPPEEYYDIEARIMSDFLTILGYESVFVGANTPYKDFYDAISYVNPELVLISVSNYYNVVSTKKIIDDLKNRVDGELKIVVFGLAFDEDEKLYKNVGADYQIKCYEELKGISNL